MTDAPKLLLAHHPKTLKLPTFLREHEKLARQCAAEGLDHVQFLARLVELELIDREQRMIGRRIKAANSPQSKIRQFLLLGDPRPQRAALPGQGVACALGPAPGWHQARRRQGRFAPRKRAVAHGHP